jgi:formylmethanofuran dehydrogenase subunit D
MLDLKIIYEDNDVLTIEKPAGIIVFPEENNRSKAKPYYEPYSKTLIDYLLEKYPDLKNIGEVPRYGIVHRLDKDTSGILLVAKSNESLIFLQKQFSAGAKALADKKNRDPLEKKVEKKYIALVCGNVKQDNGTIHTLIGRAKGDPRKQKSYPLEYGDSKEILKEIRAVIPGYGSLGPSPIPPTVNLAAVDRYVNGGYRQKFATRYTLPAQAVRPEGTVQLGLVQSLFHSGKLSTHSKGLLQIEPSGFLQMNPADAARCALCTGDRVRLSNSRGEFTTTVKVLDRVPEGLAWFPDHFAREALQLFDCVIDPDTKAPCCREVSVSLMKTT